MHNSMALLGESLDTRDEDESFSQIVGGDSVVRKSSDFDHNATITIVIQMNGEMGNYLSKFAFGYAVKWILKEDYNLKSQVVLRHRTHRSWVKAWESIQSCFPMLRSMDISQGNSREFRLRWTQQQSWLGDERFVMDKCTANENCLRESLDAVASILSNVSTSIPQFSPDANITLPFLYIKSFVQYDFIIDRYYDRLRDLFAFDLNNPQCCKERAQVHETVFHARGFEAESPALSNSGFEELNPNQTVALLFKNHKPGTKIAVLSRFASFGQTYVDQMRSKHLDARLVQTETGEQSFCFLMSSSYEIVGGSKSTFMMWAAYLGNASIARVYSVASRPNVTGELLSYKAFRRRSFNRPDLKKKFVFECYDPQSQTQLETDPKKEKFVT